MAPGAFLLAAAIGVQAEVREPPEAHRETRRAVLDEYARAAAGEELDEQDPLLDVLSKGKLLEGAFVRMDKADPESTAVVLKDGSLFYPGRKGPSGSMGTAGRLLRGTGSERRLLEFRGDQLFEFEVDAVGRARDKPGRPVDPRPRPAELAGSRRAVGGLDAASCGDALRDGVSAGGAPVPGAGPPMEARKKTYQGQDYLEITHHGEDLYSTMIDGRMLFVSERDGSLFTPELGKIGRSGDFLPRQVGERTVRLAPLGVDTAGRPLYKDVTGARYRAEARLQRLPGSCCGGGRQVWVSEIRPLAEDPPKGRDPTRPFTYVDPANRTRYALDRGGSVDVFRPENRPAEQGPFPREVAPSGATRGPVPREIKTPAAESETAQRVETPAAVAILPRARLFQTTEAARKRLAEERKTAAAAQELAEQIEGLLVLPSEGQYGRWREAAEALGAMGKAAKEHVGPLLRALGRPQASSNWEAAYAQGIAALERIGVTPGEFKSTVLPELRASLLDPSGAHGARVKAAALLAQIGSPDEQTRRALSDADRASQPREIREAARKALEALERRRR